MVKAALPAAERVIRRYDNRKLYDAQARRYVTLEELARLVAAGTEVRVVEQRTGEDITTVVLAQVVLEGIKQRTANIPHQVLSRLIRLGSSRTGGLAEWLDPQEASTRARHEAERIVSRPGPARAAHPGRGPGPAPGHRRLRPAPRRRGPGWRAGPPAAPAGQQ